MKSGVNKYKSSINKLNNDEHKNKGKSLCVDDVKVHGSHHMSSGYDPISKSAVHTHDAKNNPDLPTISQDTHTSKNRCGLTSDESHNLTSSKPKAEAANVFNTLQKLKNGEGQYLGKENDIVQ